MSRVGRPCPKCGAGPVPVCYHWACARCGVEWWDRRDLIDGKDVIEAYRARSGSVSVEIPDGCLLILGSREVNG